MTSIDRQPRYSKEEHARLGGEIYARDVRPKVEAASHGKIVAIDVDSGDYEVANDVLTASQTLLKRLPDAQIWCVRIGYDAVHRAGVCSSDSGILPTLHLGVTLPEVDLNDSAAIFDIMEEEADS